MSLELEWTKLAPTTASPEKRLKFDEVKGQFKKVAWDVYKPLDNSEIFWELREDADGTKYLYSMYEDSPIKVNSNDADELAPLTATASLDWQAICDHQKKNITLAFRNVPIKRFSASEFNFAPDEAESFAKFIQLKASDESFVNELMRTLPESTQLALASIINGKSEE